MKGRNVLEKHIKSARKHEMKCQELQRDLDPELKERWVQEKLHVDCNLVLKIQERRKLKIQLGAVIQEQGKHSPLPDHGRCQVQISEGGISTLESAQKRTRQI